MLKVVCLIFLSVSFCDCVFTPAGFSPYNGAPRRSYLVSSLANTLHSSSNQAAPKSANNLGSGGSPPTQPQYVAPQQPQVLESQKQQYGHPQQPQQLQYGQQPPNGQPQQPQYGQQPPNGQPQQPQQPQYGQQPPNGQPQQPQYGQQPQNGQPQQPLYGQQPQNGQPQQPLYGQQPQAQYGQPQQPLYGQQPQAQVLQPQQPQYGEPQQPHYSQQPLPQAKQPQYGQSQQTQQAQYGELQQQQQQYDQLQQSQVLQPQQPQYGSQPQNVQSQQSQVQQPQQLQYDQHQQPQDVQPVQTETAQQSQRPTAKYFPNLQERLSAFKSSTAPETAQKNTESNTGTPSIEPRTLPFAHLRASFKRNSRPTASAAAVPPAPQVPVTPAPRVPVTPAPQSYDPPAPQAYDRSVPQTYVQPVPQNYAPTATQQHTQPAPQQHTPPVPQHNAQPAAQQYVQPAPQQYVPPAQQQYVPPAQQQYAQSAPQQYAPPAPQQYAQSAPQQYVPPENQQYAPPTPQQYVPPAQQQYVAPAPQKTSSPTLFPHFARPQPKQTATRPLPKPIVAPSPQAGNSTQQNAQPGLIINRLGTLTIPPGVTNTQSPPFIISPADFDPNIDSNVDGTTPPMQVTQKPKILMNIYYSHDNTYHKPPVGQEVPVQVSPPKPRKPPASRKNLPAILDANNFISFFEDKDLEKSFGVTKKQKYAILEEMNKRRANIRFGSNINVLRWNETLAERAAAEINSCLYFNKGNGAIYAMIYEKHTGTSLISEAVSRWANEKNRFRLKAPCNETKSCRYSQIVWADTKEVGCARQTCNDMSMVACMYHPPGNVIGGKAYQPGRPCSNCEPGSKCNSDQLCEW